MEEPKPAPVLDFKDELGKPRTYATDKGSTLTAVHFWATWCVPCVAELPQVDATQKAYAAKGFKVIAISLDGATAMPKVKQFLEDHKITQLKPFLDNNTASFKATGIPGLPATIFINVKGEEIGRAEGPLDWKKAQTIAYIETKLAEKP